MKTNNPTKSYLNLSKYFSVIVQCLEGHTIYAYLIINDHKKTGL